jgi:hypothetical protein
MPGVERTAARNQQEVLRRLRSQTGYRVRPFSTAPVPNKPIAGLFRVFLMDIVKMNIIFVGGFFPKQNTSEILSKSRHQVQSAANTFQWAFIKGLEANLEKPIKLVTAPFIGWYPIYYKDLLIKTMSFDNNNESATGSLVGFLNIPILKNYFKYLGILKHIKNKLIRNDENIIIVYSLDAAYIKASLDAKAANPLTKLCIIIPDLHEFIAGANFLYRKYIKHIEMPIFYNLLDKVDYFVVLTDAIVDYLKISHKPWVRIEGLYEVQEQPELLSSEVDKNVKIVLYTGTLDYKYGISELLDAFRLIQSTDYRLWICGGGAAAALVQERALADSRIKYFGILSRQKVLQRQIEATLLVNPRNTNGEYNKYSFPSKTMEYLGSGTPALMYKLAGIPREYFEYCYTINDNSIESLSSAIYEACQLDRDVLRMKGSLARSFIIKHKNAEVQCKKVTDMLSNRDYRASRDESA